MTRTHKLLLWAMAMLALGTFAFGVLQFAKMKDQTPSPAKAAVPASDQSNGPVRGQTVK